MTARLSCRRGIPPNRATRSFLPLRFRLASKQVLGPSPVVTFALWRAANLVTVALCLPARVFSVDVIAHASWPGAVHRLCPFALWSAITGRQIGRSSLLRLLRALRHP